MPGGAAVGAAVLPAAPDSQTDVAQLALQPSLVHPRAGVGVECCRGERLTDPLEHARARRQPLGAQQGAGGLHERRHRGPFVLGGLAEGAGARPPGEHLGLHRREGVAGREQLVELAWVLADELVDGPRGHRRFAQGRDRRGLVAAPGGPQLAGEGGALGDEALEGQAVELAGVHFSSILTAAV